MRTSRLSGTVMTKLKTISTPASTGILRQDTAAVVGLPATKKTAFFSCRNVPFSTRISAAATTTSSVGPDVAASSPSTPHIDKEEASAAIKEKENITKVAVAMSGGVDSAVVAHLLQQQQRQKQQRHESEEVLELVGIHMSNWDYHDEGTSSYSSSTESSFCWEQDWKDARSVASYLNIPIHHVSFSTEYWHDVFEPYVDRLSNSITPNPDIDCNRYIKFGVLKDYIKRRHGVDWLATGHYARIYDSYHASTAMTGSHSRTPMPQYLQEALNDQELISSGITDYLVNNNSNDDSCRSRSIILMSARDRSKDQSYFLSGVPIMKFANVMFPLGDLYKNDQNDDDCNIGGKTHRSVRQIAIDAELPQHVATKRDSVGICFVGKRKHGQFINEYVTPPTLQISSKSDSSHEVKLINIEDECVVGTFDPTKNPSLLYATAGQGAKISGATRRWFVVDSRRPDQSHLLVCPGTHHPALYSDRLYIKANNMNWLAVTNNDSREDPAPPLPIRVKCRIRHLQPLVECEIRIEKNDGNADRYVVELKVPLRGIAPGQICAFYVGGPNNDLICLGGGPIDERGTTYWERQQDLPITLHPAGHNDRSSSYVK